MRQCLDGPGAAYFLGHGFTILQNLFRNGWHDVESMARVVLLS